MNNIIRTRTQFVLQLSARNYRTISWRSTVCAHAVPLTLRNNYAHVHGIANTKEQFGLKYQSFTASRRDLSSRTMKLETPEFKALFTPELVKLQDLFQKYGHEIRIAGGAVRDLLRGIQPDDVDFATTATPLEMKELFEKESIRMINARGESHGTITCRINDKENFEVTTLRIDVVTDGRHAEVEFTKDWEVDALRRDLTINSMFLDFDGNLYDYFNGEADLKDKRVKFVGDATSRIQEDYLRILRYFRFYGRIADNEAAHESSTLDAIRQNAHGLKGISGERIWVEIRKILNGRHAEVIIKVMLELGIGQYIGFPENPDVEEMERVWSRCQDLEPDHMTILVSLLRREEQIYNLLDRVKMSKIELQMGRFIIMHREDDFGSDKFRHCQDIICDTAGKEPQVKLKVSELLKYLNYRDTLTTFSTWTPPRFPVTGVHLMEKGVKKGPIMAKTLAALREKWKESDYAHGKDELLVFVDELKETIK